MADISVISRFKKAWNVFLNNDKPENYNYSNLGPVYSNRIDRPYFSRGNERSIVTTIYNRIAVDVSDIAFSHARLDENKQYLEDIEDSLNYCLTVSANTDQTHRAFIQDIVISLFDEGTVAIVPIETSEDPDKTDAYDIYSMRTGKIIQWASQKVQVRLYNERTGKEEDVWFYKKNIGIVENPFYSIMNEPNSTAKRLITKLNILDAIDKQSGSGKLDLIIQLPYQVKTEVKKRQADERKEEIERQLVDGQYGIAYVDATEKITQLNRPVENNLMKQIEYLTSMLYGQLGISQALLDGSAGEQDMVNYYNRIVMIVVACIVEEMKRKFLSKTAISQKQTIYAYRDPFKFISMTNMADAADKFTRNEILSSNEIRQKIGMRPSKDPAADELKNKNIRQPTDGSENSKIQNEGGLLNGK